MGKRKFWIRNFSWLIVATVAVGIALFIWAAFMPRFDVVFAKVGNLIAVMVSMTALFLAASQTARTLTEIGDNRAKRIRQMQNLTRLLKRDIEAAIFQFKVTNLHTTPITGFVFDEQALQIAFASIDDDDWKITKHLPDLEEILSRVRNARWTPNAAAFTNVSMCDFQVDIRVDLNKAVDICQSIIKNCTHRLSEI